MQIFATLPCKQFEAKKAKHVYSRASMLVSVFLRTRTCVRVQLYTLTYERVLVFLRTRVCVCPNACVHSL